MLYEAFLDEAETATERRPSVRTNGLHNGQKEQRAYIQNKDGSKTETERFSRDFEKSNKFNADEKGFSSRYHHSVDIDGKETKYDSKKDKDAYDKAKKYANKELKPGLFKKADPEKVSQAADAISRHDRRHPDRKIVESFDVSEFE